MNEYDRKIKAESPFCISNMPIRISANVSCEARGVVGCHRVAVLFVRQRQLIDVLSLEDLTTAQRVTGAAELRRRRGTRRSRGRLCGVETMENHGKR